MRRRVHHLVGGAAVTWSLAARAQQSVPLACAIPFNERWPARTAAAPAKAEPRGPLGASVQAESDDTN
jgi:hypothetical protein